MSLWDQIGREAAFRNPGATHAQEFGHHTAAGFDRSAIPSARLKCADPEAVECAEAILSLSPMPLIDPADWAGQPVPERQWILHELVMVGQVTYLTGEGASGKSLLGQQMATCIATGRPFLGVEVRPGIALYKTCEDAPDEMHRRMAQICDALRIELTDLSGRLYLASLVGEIGNELVTFDPQGRMATTPAWEKLRAVVLRTHATFVVLDNVAHLFAGDENRRHDVAAFLSLLNGLAAESGAAILLIGHPNKAGAEFSGSTAWENQVRSRLFLNRPRDREGRVLDPDARLLLKGKANYARSGDAIAFRWHRWAFVLQSEITPAQADESQAAADEAIFLRCLAERTRQARSVSEKRSPTFAPTIFAEMPEGRPVGKVRLEEAMERLFRSGAIERAVLGRDSGKGRDIVGLRAIDTHPQTVSPNAPRTRFPNDPQTPSRTPPHTYSTPKGVSGAALAAAAPAEEAAGRGATV